MPSSFEHVRWIGPHQRPARSSGWNVVLVLMDKGAAWFSEGVDGVANKR